jgi:hypothetical protein
VLWAPRHATCLDLAAVFAGACLVAGLHAIVVILDPAVRGVPAMTIVFFPEAQVIRLCPE